MGENGRRWEKMGEDEESGKKWGKGGKNGEKGGKMGKKCARPHSLLESSWDAGMLHPLLIHD